MKVHLATCIFSWEGFERRSTRYGAIMLSKKSYENHTTKRFRVQKARIAALLDRRVRLTAEVVESRPSGHAGDRFLKIEPNPKAVGEVVDLGIGTLRQIENVEEFIQLALEPDDGRKSYWINPYRFYELHDQTVKLFAEETADRAPEPFKETGPVNDEVIMLEDNTFQARTTLKEYIIPPDLEMMANSKEGTVEITAVRKRLKPGDRLKIAKAEEVKATFTRTLRETFEKI